MIRLLLAATLALFPAAAADMFVFFGTHTAGPGHGFSMSHFDTDTGVLTKSVYLMDAPAPAFFFVHPDGKHPYTVNSPGFVSAYTVDPATARLTLLNQQPCPGDPSYISLDKTRRYVFVANYEGGNFAILVNEMGSTVIFFDWDSARGALTELQTVSTLPADFKGTSNCAEIDVHPNGKFLYASNRGHDSLAVFAIDARTGRLTLVERVPTQGKLPRNFAFDPTAHWLVVTNHGSDNAMVFRVDENTGKLTPKGEPVWVPSPFCERFLPVAGGGSR